MKDKFNIGDIILAPNEFRYIILPNVGGMYKGNPDFVTLALWEKNMFDTVVRDIPIHSFNEGKWKKVA